VTFISGSRYLTLLGILLACLIIACAATAAGADISKELLEKAKTKPALIVFDLNFETVSPLALIAKLKGNAETKGISLIGYLSHIQGDLKMQAQQAGCDMVLARSALSMNMLQIFKRHSGV